MSYSQKCFYWQRKLKLIDHSFIPRVGMVWGVWGVWVDKCSELDIEEKLACEWEWNYFTSQDSIKEVPFLCRMLNLCILSVYSNANGCMGQTWWLLPSQFLLTAARNEGWHIIIITCLSLSSEFIIWSGSLEKLSTLDISISVLHCLQSLTGLHLTCSLLPLQQTLVYFWEVR